MSNPNNNLFLLAHRGLPKSTNNSDTKESFFHAINSNIGIELDVRNHLGSIVVSHDPIKEEPILLLEDIFKFVFECKYKKYIAINIKEDNLQDSIIKLIEKYKIENWFSFDHSIPDLLISKKLNAFIRISEYEPLHKIFDLDKYEGFWLDSFNSPFWYDLKYVENLLTKGNLAIVSSDLHGFSPYGQWSLLKNLIHEPIRNKLFLCTDLIDQAKHYFFE